VLAAATEDHDSVVELTRALVAIASRGGIDPYEPVLDHVAGWLAARFLSAAVLRDSTGAAVALTCEVVGARRGPRWVLDACLDTAPYGDLDAWSHSPTSAHVADGWLFGRGSADSTSGAAIFCHIAARIAAVADQLAGQLVLLFDVDEHTGVFGGAKTYFTGLDDVAGVMIGYPGMNKLVVVGGRGVHRAQLHVHGVASHSGGSDSTPSAIEKAAHLARALSDAELPAGDTRPTHIQVDTCWPAYAMPENNPLSAALIDAAASLGVEVQARIAGPSNIGNYLSGLGIPATAGFGVTYVGLHGTDERILVDSVPVVQAVYHKAVLGLLGG
jgi:succinyl-diaminopimelate desuccinylase